MRLALHAVSAAVVAWSGQTSSSCRTSSAFSPVNANLGFETHLGDHWPVCVGLFTNLSSAPDAVAVWTH